MIDYLSLKSLRDQINAGTKNVTFVTDDGAPTQMVYIPRFTIPAGSMDTNGFPASDLTLGGFFSDKYPASHKKATSTSMGCSDSLNVSIGDTINIPVSMPGRVPWVNIDQVSARNACANKKINGVACHLITMEEWTTLIYLSIILGHEIHGNNQWGRDYRDADVPASYGIRDSTLESYLLTNGKKIGRTLTGTGPLSWSHNGTENGVMDLVGNIYEWNDFTMTGGLFTAKEKASLNGALAIDAVSIAVDYVDNSQNWPASGKVQIDNEVISYASLARSTDAAGWDTITLSGCTRGIDGTTAATHGDNTAVYEIQTKCIIPNGATAFLASDMAIDATSMTYQNIIYGPGNNTIAVNDTIQCENELFTVTAVAGNTLTVTRSAKGSSAAVHAAGKAIYKMSPEMTIASPASGQYQVGYFNTMEPSLPKLGIPAKANPALKPWYDYVLYQYTGTHGAVRGGGWGIGSFARSGLLLALFYGPSYRNIYIGFRSALTL